MPSAVARFLADLSDALAESGVRWYLFGAQAALLYGAARVTADVDVTLHKPASLSTAQLADGLERHGFRLRVTEPKFIEQTRVVPVVHDSTGLPADLVLAGPGLEEAFLERAVVHAIDGVAVSVASPEDLVVMKVLAGRPKDLEDIVAILAAQEGSFDMAGARTTVSQLEEALGQSDLTPLLDTAVARARRVR